MTASLVRLISAGFMLVGGTIAVYLLRRRERRRRVLPWLGAAVGLVAAAAGAAGLAANFLANAGIPEPPTAEEMSRPAPDFAFRLVDDDSLGHLAGLRGRVVVINLWATWCVPCVDELPDLDRLQRTWADSGVVVLRLSEESRDKLQSFAREHPMAGMDAYVSDVPSLPEPFRRGFGGFPTTYLLNREGYIRDHFIGAHTYRQVAARVAPLVAGPGG